VEAASQLQAGGARLADVLQSSAEAAGSRAKVLARVNDELRELAETHKLQLEEEERKNSQQQEVADTQHEEALKMLATYRERLGLAIARVSPQTVRMTFSLLDACQPEREFAFELGLGAADAVKNSEAYCVAECAPHVPELGKLLEELNMHASTATALPRFVCSMRRAFLKQCTPTCAA